MDRASRSNALTLWRAEAACHSSRSNGPEFRITCAISCWVAPAREPSKARSMRRNLARCCRVIRVSGGIARPCRAARSRSTASIRSKPSRLRGMIATATLSTLVEQSRTWRACPLPSAKRNATSILSRARSPRPISGALPRLSPNSAAVSASTTTLVSTCGSQRTGASGGGSIGSTGKSQPPPLPDLFGQRVEVSSRRGGGFKIGVIVIIPAQPLPCHVGCRQSIQMVVVFRRTPG
ncbi:hypothetical protein SAMN05443573_12121 [Celeribacter indicus]|nr:hypothetical protein SAMN05443573_12121 [Celeribacter indicus]